MPDISSTRRTGGRLRAAVRAALARTLVATLVGAAAAPDLAAQSHTIARADGSGSFELWLASEGGPAALLGSGVQFLPVALAGATHRDRLRLDLPTPAGSGTPAPHIRLPGGGSLFLVEAAGLAVLLHVQADGTPAAAFVAPAGSVQPQIAVAADGSAALLATTRAGGGDVLHIPLPAGTATNLTAQQAPLSIEAASLRTSASRAFFLAGNQLWRADPTAPAAQAQPVALPLVAGEVLAPATVLSADGRSLALLGVAPSGLGQLHVVTPNGVPVLLTPAPALIDAPALQSPLGPLLALSADGTHAAWRQTVGAGKELFLQAVPQPGPPPPPATQITADTYFTDTLDNAGILGFAGSALLTFVAGEVDVGAIDAADFFTAHLAGGGGGAVLENATLTSGDSVPPFLVPGELEIRAAMLDPTGQRLLFVVDPQGGDAALFATDADGSGPGTLLLPALAEDPVLVRAGTGVLVQSVPDAGAAPPTQLHLLTPSGVAPLFLGALPPGLFVDRISDSADGARAAFVVHAGPGAPLLQLPVRLDPASGALIPAWTQLLQVAPLLALPPSGALVTGVGAAGGPYISVAFTGFAAGSLLQVPAGFAFPLPY